MKYWTHEVSIQVLVMSPKSNLAEYSSLVDAGCCSACRAELVDLGLTELASWRTETFRL